MTDLTVDQAAEQLRPIFGEETPSEPTRPGETPPHPFGYQGVTVDEAAKELQAIFAEDKFNAEAPPETTAPEQEEAPELPEYKPHPLRNDIQEAAGVLMRDAKHFDDDYARIDWATLQKTNLPEFVALRQEFTQRRNALDARANVIRSHAKQVEEHEKSELDTKSKKYAEWQKGQIAKAGIDLQKDGPAIVDYLRKNGYTSEQIKMASYRDVILAHKAMIHEQVQSEAPEHPKARALRERLTAHKQKKEKRPMSRDEYYARMNAKLFPDSVETAAARLSGLLK